MAFTIDKAIALPLILAVFSRASFNVQWVKVLYCIELFTLGFMF